MKTREIEGRPRASGGFTLHDGFIYWVAGHLGQYHYYGRCHFSREAYRWDTTTGEWERLPDLPVPVQGFRMCGHDGGIFVFGGFVHEGDGEWPVRSSDVVWRYDIAARRWDDVARLKAPRSSNVLGVVGSLAYLIAGWNGQAQPSADEAMPWKTRNDPDPFHQTIEVFDLASLATKDVLPLGIPPRRAFTAVTVGAEITVACGLGPGGFKDLKSDVLTYDTGTGKWSKLFDTPTGLFSPGIAWPGHAPLIVGGLYVAPDHSSFKEFDTISTFDPHGAGGWKTLAHLESTRSFAECAVVGNELVVVGGFSGYFPTFSMQFFDAANPSDDLAARREGFALIDQHSYA